MMRPRRIAPDELRSVGLSIKEIQDVLNQTIERACSEVEKLGDEAVKRDIAPALLSFKELRDCLSDSLQLFGMYGVVASGRPIAAAPPRRGRRRKSKKSRKKTAEEAIKNGEESCKKIGSKEKAANLFRLFSNTISQVRNGEFVMEKADQLVEYIGPFFRD